MSTIDVIRDKLSEIDQLAERIRELTGGENDDWRRPLVVGEPDDLIVLEAAFLGPGHAALYARVLRGDPAVWQGDGITVCIDSCMMQFGTEREVLNLERRVGCEAFDGFYGIVPDTSVEVIADAVRGFNESFREREVSNVGLEQEA